MCVKFCFWVELEQQLAHISLSQVKLLQISITWSHIIIILSLSLTHTHTEKYNTLFFTHTHTQYFSHTRHLRMHTCIYIYRYIYIQYSLFDTHTLTVTQSVTHESFFLIQVFFNCILRIWTAAWWNFVLSAAIFSSPLQQKEMEMEKPFQPHK